MSVGPSAGTASLVPCRSVFIPRGPIRMIRQSSSPSQVDRRHLVQTAGALGIGAALAGRGVLAQDATPGASPEASPVAATGTRPAAGTDTQTRGAGDALRLLIWQAPSVAAAHSSTGDKDFLAAALVSEPLLHFLPDGTIIPNLVTEVPTVENGLLAADLSTATFSLLPDVVWSDGEPFTSRDVQFTWEWVTNQDNASVNFAAWDSIASDRDSRRADGGGHLQEPLRDLVRAGHRFATLARSIRRTPLATIPRTRTRPSFRPRSGPARSWSKPSRRTTRLRMS